MHTRPINDVLLVMARINFDVHDRGEVKQQGLVSDFLQFVTVRDSKARCHAYRHYLDCILPEIDVQDLAVSGQTTIRSPLTLSRGCILSSLHVHDRGNMYFSCILNVHATERQRVVSGQNESWSPHIEFPRPICTALLKHARSFLTIICCT